MKDNNKTNEHLSEKLQSLQKELDAVKESAFNYKTIADFAYDWDLWINPDETLKYVSPSCERITGYTPEEFMNKSSLMTDIIVQEDMPLWDVHFHDSRREMQKQEVQFRIMRKDGELRWIEHICHPVHTKQGKFLGFQVSNRDITKRKVAEDALKKALSEIRLLKDQLEAENIYLREEIKSEQHYRDIIGDSDSIKYVLLKVEQVANTDATVLILGETGTGKALVARAIHIASPRIERPFVNVNCAALPANLIESELFGREKGAFTGAQARQIGRFELANEGTIFLDEIGEMPLELQTKLLRVLQDGEFERLGSPHTIKVNVRVIASTNRNLKEEAENGRFRQDLFYRLNVFPITLPPLRKRKEDIPVLVIYFVEKYSKKMGKTINTVSKATMQMLQEYSWPGNVRELENIIERAVIISQGTTLQVADKLEPLQAVDPIGTSRKSLKDMEKGHILQVLEQTRWRIEGEDGAAAILGLNPSTLRGRMRKLGIKRT
jgi:PAS domain S-box-containing protein